MIMIILLPLLVANFPAILFVRAYIVQYDEATLDLESSTCHFEGREYNPGDAVRTGQPCLTCSCTRGSVVCHLRVCTPVPNPPPLGCYIVYRKYSCCPELVCEEENYLKDDLEGRSRPHSPLEDILSNENLETPPSQSCAVNGTIYGEGSALQSSTECRYCYCVKGEERCVQPNCILKRIDCQPVFIKHVCCPIKYNCDARNNIKIISTTETSTDLTAITAKINEISTQASNNDETYSVYVRVVENTTYITRRNASITNENETPIPSTEYDVTTTTESATEISTTISMIISEMVSNHTILERNKFFNSTGTEYSQNVTERSDSGEGEIKSGAVNATKDENNFELDYDQPTLPPSLPNLKIIPFVAADALDKPGETPIETREDIDSENIAYIPLDVVQNNQFSPPAETEGGFVPKLPSLDGPYFESVYGKTTQNSVFVSSQLPSITEIPTEPSPDKNSCYIGDVIYKHGELISEPKACNICYCLEGKNECQEPKCPPVQEGCQRSNDTSPDNCCGKIICDEKHPFYEQPIIEYKIDHQQTSFTTSTESAKIISMLVTSKDEHKIPVSSTESAQLTTVENPRNPSTESTKSPPPSTNKEPEIEDYDFSFDKILGYLFDEPTTIKANPPPKHFTQAHAIQRENKTESAAKSTTPKRFPISTSTEGTTFNIPILRYPSHPKEPNMDSPTTLNIPILRYPTRTTSLKTTTMKHSNAHQEDVLMERISDSMIEIPVLQPHNKNKHTKTTTTTPIPTATLSIRLPMYPAEYEAPNMPKMNPGTDSAIYVIKTTENDDKQWLGEGTTEHSYGKSPKPHVDSAPGLLKLKLSGCNIFGKMYKIGKIIRELSSPCLRCSCTQFGVQCDPLHCKN